MERLNLVELYNYALTKLSQEDAELAADLFVDLKLQIVTIMVFDLIHLNDHINSLSAPDSRYISPGQLELQKFLTYSHLHSEALKFSVVAERMMNLIYFLETGTNIADKFDKKKRFEEFIDSNPAWNFMRQVLAEFSQFNADIRNPETHRASVLKKAIFDNVPLQNSDGSIKLVDVLNSFIPQFEKLIAQ